jgi:7-cyano-7-deazaguanine synthase
LDSAILLGEAAQVYPEVWPIFVRVGSFWEDAEFDHLQRFLQALQSPVVRPPVVLQQPVQDLYGSHWSLDGEAVPDRSAPDEAFFLPGRNVLLLAKPLLWCLAHGIPALATAPLVTNPFPDATPEFYDGFAAIVGQAVAGKVRVLRPYVDLGLHKVDVLRRGAHFPLGQTFSCARPINGLHCQVCGKCGERINAFADAGLPDPTPYTPLTLPPV